MKKNIKLIPLFLFLFVFQLLYFLSTIYTEKIDHIFLILAVFMILICILLYCVLSDVLKKSNTEMELAFLQKQKQLKQEQDYSLQIRRQDTRDFQTKTVQELQDFQILLEQGKYEQADTAIRNLNQTFQKDRFHPYCQNNLLQAILEGKRLRAEQEHIQVSYEILLPEKISINTTDLSSIFFNLLDNAIEACSSSGNPDPEIRLSANISNGFLTIYICTIPRTRYRVLHIRLRNQNRVLMDMDFLLLKISARNIMAPISGSTIIILLIPLSYYR